MGSNSFDKELHVARNEDIILPNADTSDFFVGLGMKGDENSLQEDDLLLNQQLDPLIELNNDISGKENAKAVRNKYIYIN